MMGAQAITFCHLAAGRTDAVVVPEAVARASTSPPRSCSSASAASRSTLSDGPPLGAAPLDLEARSRIARGRERGALPAAGAALLAEAATLGSVATHEAILAALANVIDPELRKPVTELDMVRDIDDRRRRRDRDDRAHRRRLPAANSFQEQVAREVGAVEGVASVQARVRRDEPRRARRADDEAPRRPPESTRRSSSTRRPA